MCITGITIVRIRLEYMLSKVGAKSCRCRVCYPYSGNGITKCDKRIKRLGQTVSDDSYIPPLRESPLWSNQFQYICNTQKYHQQKY